MLLGGAGAGLWLRRRRAAGPAPLPQMDEARFHAAFAPLPAPEAPLHVYHLGHSLVGRDMPAMLSQLRPDHSYASQLGWGASLRQHMDDKVPGLDEENVGDAFRPAHDAIGSGEFDAVIVTEMVELKDAIRWHQSGNFLAEWAQLARDTRADVRIYLYETWHRLDDPNGWFERIEGDGAGLWEDEVLRRAMSADGVGTIYRIPGGGVLAAVARAAEAGELPGLESREDLFALTPEGTRDMIHLNDLGHYVIALCHYAALYHRDPTGLPHRLLRADGQPAEAFADSAAPVVQSLVWQVVAGDPLSGVSL